MKVRVGSTPNAKCFVTDCAEPGCARRGVCLPAIELSYDPRKALLLEFHRPDLGHTIHDQVYQVYFPARPRPIDAVLRALRKAGRSPWKPVCVKCLALAYVRTVRYERDLKRWTGSIFSGWGSTLLRAVRHRKRREAAVERLLPLLEEDITERLDAVWNNRRGKRTKSWCKPSG